MESACALAMTSCGLGALIWRGSASRVPVEKPAGFYAQIPFLGLMSYAHLLFGSRRHWDEGLVPSALWGTSESEV